MFESLYTILKWPVIVFFFHGIGFFLVPGGVKEQNSVPAASVRAFAVFAGPIPPELIADTSTTYMV